MENLPEDIIFDVLARLPVKSLVRLKSVCKSWRSHILNSYFVHLHMARTLNHHKNNSFIINYNRFHSKLSITDTNFLDIANDMKLPPKLNKPDYYDGNIVGSCNGLLCLCYKRNKQRLQRRLYLWNPATRQLRNISNYPLIINRDNHQYHYVSLGFGFDLDSSDYKVVRIVTNRTSSVSRVQVYSLNKNKISWKNGWKEIEVELEFRVIEYSSPWIIKGWPYWIVKHNLFEKFAMVTFNMQSEKFSTILLPDSMFHEVLRDISILEVKESVAVTAHTYDQGISIWTLDDDSCWSKKFTITNPQIKSIIGCLKTGEFVGLIEFSKLVLYDSVNEVVKPTQLIGYKPKTFTYFECLVNLN